MCSPALEQPIEPFPNKKYNIIYADPPWKYNSLANHKTRFRGGACGHYQLLSMSQIRELPVPKLADTNCALFMWCTFPYLKEQIQLFDYWGFKYRTCGFNWLKLNPKNGKPFFGVGYYTKSNTEVCLLGIKGRLKPVSNRVSQVILFSPKIGVFSAQYCKRLIGYFYLRIISVSAYQSVNTDSKKTKIEIGSELNFDPKKPNFLRTSI